MSVSNALGMSSAIAIVLSGGFFLLKHVVIVIFIVYSAVIVECFVCIRVGVWDFVSCS